MKRSRLIIISAVIVAVALSAALYYYYTIPPPPRELIKLREASFGVEMPYMTNSVDFLAKDLGFYEREGLDFEIIGLGSTPMVLTALRAGEVDIAGSQGSTALKLHATGDMKTVAFVSHWGHGAPSASVVVGKKEITSIQDLKGRKIGVGAVGGADQVATIPVLRANGVDPEKDITWVAVGTPSARVAALLAGRIDAITTSIMTWIPLSGNPNLKVVISGDEYSKILPTVAPTITTVDFMNKNPEALLRYTRAQIKANRYFAENKEAWIDAVRVRRPDVSRENLSQVYDYVKPGWAVNGGINLDNFEKGFEAWYGLAEFKDVQKVSVSDWVTTRFVDQALKEVALYKDRSRDDPGRTVAGAMQAVAIAKEEDRLW